MHSDDFSTLATKLDDLGKRFDDRLDDLGKTTSNIWQKVGGIDKRLAVVEAKTEHLDSLPTMDAVKLEIASCRESRRDQTGAVEVQPVPPAPPEKGPSWSTVAKIVVAILAAGASVAATLAAAM